MPATPASRSSSSRYILALVLVGLGGALSAAVGAVASGLVILSGFLAFEGRPLKRSLAGYLLGGDDLGPSRRKWLSIVDLLVGAAIMTFSLSLDRQEREPPRATAVGERGEVRGGTVSHGGGAASCSPGLLPSTVSRGSLEAFLARKGMALSARPRGDVVPILKAPRVDLPDVEADMFLDFDEAHRVVQAARPQDRAWIFFAIRTGLRLGELRGLRWDSLDLDNRAKSEDWTASIRVAQQLTRDGPGPTKGRRPRTIHLAGDLVAILRAQPKRGLYVFTDEAGRPLTRGAIDYAVREAGRRAGLNKPVHPHTLRHTFVSHALMNGVPIPVVQAWAGHADVKMTLRYSHLAASTSAAFAQQMATAPQTTRLNPVSITKRSKSGARNG